MDDKQPDLNRHRHTPAEPKRDRGENARPATPAEKNGAAPDNPNEALEDTRTHERTDASDPGHS